jgi:hypothetical protein
MPRGGLVATDELIYSLMARPDFRMRGSQEQKIAPRAWGTSHVALQIAWILSEKTQKLVYLEWVARSYYRRRGGTVEQRC